MINAPKGFPMNPCGISTTFAGIPRFSVGDRVRVAMRFPLGHYRTPIYVRGKVGCIERVLPKFLNPEQEGYGKNSGTLVRLYRVRIPQNAIWPDYQGNPADELQIEIYEHWLEPA
jgi:nitrile hydratase subunit beta